MEDSSRTYDLSFLGERAMVNAIVADFALVN